MSQRPILSLSYIILCGTAVYCLIQLKDRPLFCPHATYGVIIINSIVGLWRHGTENGINRDGLYRFTAYTQLLFALPCITTTVWLANGYQKEISWAWTLVPVFPWLCYVLQGDYLDMPMVELLLILNSIALGVVAFMVTNSDGIVAAVAFIVSHFCVRDLAIYNFGLCVFSYFALKAIN